MDFIGAIWTPAGAVLTLLCACRRIIVHPASTTPNVVCATCGMRCNLIVMSERALLGKIANDGAERAA